MSDTTIVDQIHAFIRDEILCGQDAGLSPTTPLLELGILDSFALLKLVAHFNGAYAIDIRPDEITGQHFRHIEAIGRLLTHRIASTRAQAHAADGPALEGPAVFEVPACAQAFILFTGLGHPLNTGRRAVNWPASAFFEQSALIDRNVIVFGDPYGQSYRSGVSTYLSTPLKVFEWVERWLGERRHIEEVYCLGMSAGGPIAMIAGEYLRARRVWAFGPRAVRGELARAMPQALVQTITEATGKTLEQLGQQMTDADRDAIDAMCTPELMDRYYRSFRDPDTVLDMTHLAELAEVLSRPNGLTCLVGRGDMAEQTRQAIRNMRTVLEAAGGTLEDIVSIVVYTTDMRTFKDIVQARTEFFTAKLPTSTIVEVNHLADPGLLIEFQAIAAL